MIKTVLRPLLILFCFYSFFGTSAAFGRDAFPGVKSKKIVLIAGEKSHGSGDHEYIKSVRLLKTMLDQSKIEGIATEIHLHGWPKDPETLEDADLILFISDGRDGHLYSDVPFMTEERMRVMERQMDRGCGFSLIHFSTFASDEIGQKVIQWGGGYFDWQDEQGERNWYSSIKTLEGSLELPTPGHPILSGVAPFTMKDEYYYNIRFLQQDPRLQIIAAVPELEGREGNGNAVAWAVEREDGGRGFSTTMGHSFVNWQNPQFRKLILNGIVWAAGGTVPRDGVEAGYFTDREVTQHLYGKSQKALILTGNHHPGHPWRETSDLIKSIVENGTEFFVDISTNMEDLSQYDLADYDALILNYANWEDPTPLSEFSKKAFTGYLLEGGGLMVIHFANGAFHYSLPNAGDSDWPEYREIVRRVWDHHADSGHDSYGEFKVNIADRKHPIASGIAAFRTTDELYFNQKGEKPIEPILTATSMVTGKEEPLAWAYNYGSGRIFQTLLGHDSKSFGPLEIHKILQNAVEWVSGIKEE